MGEEKESKREKVKAHGLRSMGLLFCYLVTLPLGNEDAAWVGGFAAEEGEEQIQSWEVKDLHMRAAAWAYTGDQVCNAIAVGIVNGNANAPGEDFCVSHELSNEIACKRIPNCYNRGTTQACAGSDFENAIVAYVAYCDENAAGEGYGVGIPLAND